MKIMKIILIVITIGLVWLLNSIKFYDKIFDSNHYHNQKKKKYFYFYNWNLALNNGKTDCATAN